MYKKHIRPEDHVGYTTPYSLFDGLSEEEREDIDEGSQVFQAKHPGVRIFPDPFVSRKEAHGRFFLRELVIVAGTDAFTKKAAETISRAISEKWGVQLLILTADDPQISLDTSAPLLIIGGAESNPLSLQIARKYQVGLFCANFPGPGGWGLMTHWKLSEDCPPRYLLSCDEETLVPAIDAFLKFGVGETEERLLRWLHKVSPGRMDCGLEADFDSWISANRHKYPLLKDWLDSGRSRPYREVFNAFFHQDFSEGLPYNATLIDIGIDALRYYQFTGDEKGLDLFREMMWGFWEYLNSDDPRVYISDMDFRIGNICNLWNWVESSPLIAPEERRLFPYLLLGSLRIVKDYFHHKWKTKPGPHNHQTFKARSLILGWRYFKNWDLPDVDSWKADADGVFEPIDPRAFKHLENAGTYEVFIPEHTLVWTEATDRILTPEGRESLVKFAQREWAMRDTFLYALDYGDCDPEMKPNRPIEVAPWLTRESEAQAGLLDMELTGSERFPFEFPSPIKGFPGITVGNSGCSLNGPVGWMRLPLDPLLERNYPLTGDPELRFDKLAWRGAWAPEAAYLALEGFGNRTVSHSHNEVNGIIRLNLAGRIWLVSNGYGRLPGIVDAAKAYRTRQVGPEDHNMLIVRNLAGDVIIPPVNAVLYDLAAGPLPFAVSEISNYGGLQWRRHLFLLPDTGLLVIDHVESHHTEPVSVELQWNILGRKEDAVRGIRFEQSGETLLCDHFRTADPIWEPSRITAWCNAIGEGHYPHTQASPTHCRLRHGQGQLGPGESHYFVNGFWLDEAVRSWEWDPATKVCSLECPNLPDEMETSVRRPWGDISVNHQRLTIAFS